MDEKERKKFSDYLGELVYSALSRHRKVEFFNTRITACRLAHDLLMKRIEDLPDSEEEKELIYLNEIRPLTRRIMEKVGAYLILQRDQDFIIDQDLEG